MEGLLEAIAAALADMFGEVILRALFYALPALVWAGGAFGFVRLTMRVQEAWPAALVAFLCGGALTVASAQGVKWARTLLLAGLVFSLGALIWLGARVWLLPNSRAV